MLPSVSVIIPCYNVDEYVQSSIESAVDQTMNLHKIVCIDDGSEDGTLRILRKLENKHKNVVVRSQQNSGQCAARNEGLGMCTTKYVCFLDADDILHPEKIEHQVQITTESSSWPDLVAGASRSVYIDEPDKPCSVDIPETDKWVGLIKSFLGITSSNLWKASAVRDVGKWNEDIERTVDTELMFRMLRDGKTVKRDPKVLTTLRRRNDSVWNHDLVASRKAFLKLRCQIKSYLESSGKLTKNRVKAFASLFSKIRKVQSYDPQFASRMYDELVSDKYRPSFGSLYDTVNSVLGFRAAEAFYTWYAPLRKKYFPPRNSCPE